MENNNKNIEKFKTGYEAGKYEKSIYEKWEQSGYFNPDNMPQDKVKLEKFIREEVDKNGNKSEIVDLKEKTFTIVMPPPNANGSLHAGHALFVTIQDILIRYHRMNGARALWLPGADHAGFETQVVYEKVLEKQGRSRFDMTRQELYSEIFKYTQENKIFMEGQIRDLGASCDWSRSLFTLDASVIKTVNNTFKKLDDDKLLYRGKRIVNWCPKHQTSLSNLETDHLTRKDPFYYFKYGPFTIGTVRPETKFGDKYVVMHPDDARYANYAHGQKIKVEWINGEIEATIIKDNNVDPEFGTGVMTITPWHSGVDFDIAKRHNLDMEQIIDERGKLLPIANEFSGMNIKDARLKIVEKLEAKGLLVKVDTEYSHEISVCYKCEREIEPQIKAQWFVNMKPLAEKAIKALDDKKFEILTEQHEKIFRHWMNNVQDWNISRQIVWGINIPAKICDACDTGYVDIEDKLKNCEKCNGQLRKEIDTFDTWFSSGQWPLTTLNYPDSQDFKKYYPTSVMETGADIIFFWVARMIMFGLYLADDVPFKKVYLHGMVRDAQGKKMSKSKGNVISPLEVSDEYGTDALRMGLIVNNAPGMDMNLDPKKVGAYKKFANKIWNATRFILEAGEQNKYDEKIELTEVDLKIYADWKLEIEKITDDIENYRLHLASEKLYNYFWKTLCDIIIEDSKKHLNLFGGLAADPSLSRMKLLDTLLRENIIALHPFMPFITEEIWASIRKESDDHLIVAEWVG